MSDLMVKQRAMLPPRQLYKISLLSSASSAPPPTPPEGPPTLTMTLRRDVTFGRMEETSIPREKLQLLCHLHRAFYLAP